MSNPDSFIDEVAEEVRRDRLFGLARRYGWIAIALVLAIVGGAGWREYDNARRTAAAQALGDALLSATDLTLPEARQNALAAIEAGPDGRALAVLLRAGDAAILAPGAEALRDGVLRDLAALAEDQAVSEPLRDLAVLRRVLLAPQPAPGSAEAASARLALAALAQPGRTFRPLAEEQLALLDIAEGALAEADARLAALINDAAAPTALRRRAGDLRTAIGTAPEAVGEASGAGATP